MFRLAEIKDYIRIVPEYLSDNILIGLKQEINRKFANKVILNLGLCIALKDIVTIDDGILLPNDGAAHTRVTFRLIVFQPKIDSILSGKIRSCTTEGVHVTLGFFDDILIPPSTLQHPSRYDETEGAWVWEYLSAGGSKHDLFMDIGELIKFRIADESFHETMPMNLRMHLQSNTQSSPNSTCTTKTIPPQIPYKILGAINDSGLGVVSWWMPSTEESDDTVSDEDIASNVNIIDRITNDVYDDISVDTDKHIVNANKANTVIQRTVNNVSTNDNYCIAANGDNNEHG